MDVINEEKLQAAADEVSDRTLKSLGELVDQVMAKLDGWTLTIHIPAWSILGFAVRIPDITVRLNKPKP